MQDTSHSEVNQSFIPPRSHISQKIIDCAEAIAPESLHHPLIETILIVSEADPQLPRKSVSEEEHTSLMLSRTSYKGVQLDVREAGMFVNPIQIPHK
jgi:hypothetical protein